MSNKIRIREVIEALVFRYGNTAVTLLIGIMITRSLGQVERGQLGLAQATVDLAANGLTLGLSKTLLNYSVATKAFRRHIDPLLFRGGVALIGALVLCLLLGLTSRTGWLIAALIALFYLGRVLLDVVDTRERGRQRFRTYYLMFGAERLTLLAIVAPLALLGMLSLKTALLSMACSLLLVFVGYLAFSDFHWTRPRPRLYPYFIKRTWTIGIFNTLASFVTLALLRVDLFAVERGLDMASVAQFTVAMTLVNLVTGVAQGLVFVALPKLTGRRAEKTYQSSTAAWAITAGTILLAYAVLFPLAPFVFSILYGQRYESSGHVFQFLIPLGVAYSMRTMVQVRLVAQNRFREIAALDSILVVVKVAGLFVIYTLGHLSLETIALWSGLVMSLSVCWLLYRLRPANARIAAEAPLPGGL